MKILVTGSAGLIGQQVVKDLTQLGDTVYSAYHESKSEQGIPIQIDLTGSRRLDIPIWSVRPTNKWIGANGTLDAPRTKIRSTRPLGLNMMMTDSLLASPAADGWSFMPAAAAGHWEFVSTNLGTPTPSAPSPESKKSTMAGVGISSGAAGVRCGLRNIW